MDAVAQDSYRLQRLRVLCWILHKHRCTAYDYANRLGPWRLLMSTFTIIIYYQTEERRLSWWKSPVSVPGAGRWKDTDPATSTWMFLASSPQDTYLLASETRVWCKRGAAVVVGIRRRTRFHRRQTCRLWTLPLQHIKYRSITLELCAVT